MRVLSDENMALLKYIREQRPESVSEVASALGKQAPNVSRSLHTMEQFGLVRMVKQGRVVKTGGVGGARPGGLCVARAPLAGEVKTAAKRRGRSNIP